MTKLCIGDIDLSEYLWRDINIHDRTLIEIDRFIIALDPAVALSHGGPGEWSGIQWTFFVKKDGTRTDHDASTFAVGEDEQWQIALSYRGPVITALSWQGRYLPEDRPGLLSMIADKVVSPTLVAMVKRLAIDLRLRYLDAHELMALEIPWEDLQVTHQTGWTIRKHPMHSTCSFTSDDSRIGGTYEWPARFYRDGYSWKTAQPVSPPR